MATAQFDTRELDEFTEEMIRFVSREFPKEAKAFMNREGNDGRRMLRRYTKAVTTKRTGNLLKGINKSQVAKRGDSFQVRVYNKAPHAHLIERGHVFYWRGTPTDKYVPGRHPAARTQKSMKKWFPKDAERWIERLLKEGFR